MTASRIREQEFHRTHRPRIYRASTANFPDERSCIRIYECVTCAAFAVTHQFDLRNAMNIFFPIAQHDARKPNGFGLRARDEHGHCD